MTVSYTHLDVYKRQALEVAEAVEILKGRGPEDLKEVCLSLAAAMLETAGKGSFGECRQLAETAVRDGSALSCLERMVEAQGGDCLLYTSRCV